MALRIVNVADLWSGQEEGIYHLCRLHISWTQTFIFRSTLTNSGFKNNKSFFFQAASLINILQPGQSDTLA